jgi:gingipain R
MTNILRVTLCIGAVLWGTTTAEAAWVSIDGASPGQPVVRTVAQDDRTVAVEIIVPGFETDAVAIEGQSYAKVMLPGHVQRLERGLPQLPYVTVKLIIADEGSVSARIVTSEWIEIDTTPVVPSKGVILRTVDPATVPYVFEDIYRAGGVFPATEIELGQPYIVRDWRGVNVRVNALRWDATRGVLLALRSLTVEVQTSGAGGVNAKQRIERAGIDPQFAGIYNHGFVNYDGGAKYQPIATGGPLLIVCYDAFVGTIAPFVEWKSQRGMAVELITTSSCGGTVAGIQTAINERYFSDNGLTYVVLVGDRPQLPCYSGTNEGADDDTRYAMVEGSDLYPDFFVSRISGSNPVDIQKQINKFIRYEKQPDAGGDWYHMATGLASNEGSPPDYERANWLRDDLLGYTFTDVDQIYQPSATAAHITAAVNDGRSLINYIGHGSGVSWSNPPFNIGNVYALTNGWAQPWILDVSCSNGDFSNDECFAEAWLRVGTPDQPHGAVAMYSASTSTPWVPPCVMQAEAIDYRYPTGGAVQHLR